MKGIVFTTFLDMVEDKFGYETVDSIIADSTLASNGIYTSVGTYSHQEIVQLVVALSKLKQIEVSELLKIFGKHLFEVLSKNYPMFMEASNNVFDFLSNIENYIHVEVKKLYPDAELPTFETVKLNDNQLKMIYHSERKMADLAYGLIQGSLEYYKEKATIEISLLNEEQTNVLFLITKEN